MLPVVWVVTDSGSSDGSFQYSGDLFEATNGFTSFTNAFFHGQGYADENMSAAINEGYECAKKLCADRHVDYSYVGKTDATPIFSRTTLKTLHKEMEKDPQLAFTCGIERLKIPRKNQGSETFPEFVKRMDTTTSVYIERNSLTRSADIPLTPSPDAVSMVKAANRGWKYAIVEQTYFVKPRLQGAKIGCGRGTKQKGTKLYRLGYHPILLLRSQWSTALSFPLIIKPYP